MALVMESDIFAEPTVDSAEADAEAEAGIAAAQAASTASRGRRVEKKAQPRGELDLSPLLFFM